MACRLPFKGQMTGIHALFSKSSFASLNRLPQIGRAAAPSSGSAEISGES
jgi:hypothetical protein